MLLINDLFQYVVFSELLSYVANLIASFGICKNISADSTRLILIIHSLTFLSKKKKQYCLLQRFPLSFNDNDKRRISRWNLFLIKMYKT
jgi:hypothetical protein